MLQKPHSDAGIQALEPAMDVGSRIENALQRAMGRALDGHAPANLSDAMRHAVFPGGARIRARLCLATELTDAALAAIEILHCASLVHDDMPCFDNAAIRRGKASVHAKFGEPLALLSGDALIVLAFEIIAADAGRKSDRIGPLILTLAQAVGMPHGIVAGQGWEAEAAVDLESYHQAKTGALFVGATVAGAIAAGADGRPWRAIGERLGLAYQVADDLRDAILDEETLGKPAHQDEKFQRPNSVATFGTLDSLKRLRALIAASIEAIPACPGAGMLEALIRSEATRLVPAPLAHVAA
jgi:geranylgeranyl diphosphate synthase, type II